MFPRLRQQILARVDLLVELSTLGEYGIDEHGGVMALDPEPAPARLVPRVRDRCGNASQQWPCPAEEHGRPTAPGRGVPARP